MLHGPSYRFNVEQLIDNYRDWSMAVGKGTTQIAVLYAADYGFSDRLSQTLAKGITKAGVKTEMVDVLSVDPQVGCVLKGATSRLGLGLYE
jgi:flavorubredoxin